jgi:hypothetical protein
MHPDSIEKTAFIGPDGLYQWLVRPFGLANTPSEFMRLMTELLRKHIDGGYCIVFLDDIMIYSKNEESHEKHMQAVMDSIRRKGFRLQGKKCQFGQAEAPFLGLKVNGSGISMTSEKVATIADWPEPATPKEMRSFVGLSGIYCHFVKNFAKITTPLTALLNVTPVELNKVRNDPEQWKQVTCAIDVLKAVMLAHPALALPSKEGGQYLVWTDASDFISKNTFIILRFPRFLPGFRGF